MFDCKDRATNSTNINISAENRSQVTAVTLKDSVVHGDVNITNNFNPEGCQNSQSQISNEYKKFIADSYMTVEEYNSYPGENVLLRDRYVDLLIIQRHRDEEERQQEICSKRLKHHEVLDTRNSDKYSYTSLHQLFSSDVHGCEPRAGLLQGNSGNGKSLTVQKIMLDWANGDLYTDKFDFLFHLKCKELNVSEEMSLVDLLSSSISSEQMKEVLRSPDRLLILIDGFDELRLSQNRSSTSLLTDPWKKASPEAILVALLQRKMLAHCFLLVTTRSTTTPTLSKLLKHPYRFIEVLGFSEKAVEEYFQKFFRDEEETLYKKVYECVKANQSLYSACFIPVICWIICTYIKDRLHDGPDLTSGLETTTSIYVHFVSVLLEHHCQDLPDSVRTLLMNLGQLAEDGMLEKRVLFDEKTVKERGLDLASAPFLCKFPFKKNPIRPQFMLSFFHLSFQEFFTALYFVLLEDDDSKRKVRALLNLPDEENCDDEIENLSDHDTKEHDSPVIRFLCGLSNRTVSTTEITESYQINVSPSIQTLLKNWILQTIKRNGQKPKGKVGKGMVFILHCLYELHEEEFVRKALETWEEIDLSFTILSTTDCWVLLYCLQCCEEIKSLNLMGCLSITADKLKMLQPALCRSKDLFLRVKNLTDADVNYLVLALGEENNLRYLSIQKSTLSEQSAQQILISLTKHKYIGSVELHVTNISTDSALLLINVYQSIEVKNLKLRVVEASNCTSLNVSDSDGQFSLTYRNYSRLTDPQPGSSFSGISFTCPKSGTFGINWRNFFPTFHKLSSCTETCSEFEEGLSSLREFLVSVSELKELKLYIFSLTERWAELVLAIIQDCPTVHELSANVDYKRNKGCVCSTLSVSKRDDGDVRLYVHGNMNPESSLSSIYLTFPQSHLSTITWKHLLQALQKINNATEFCSEFEEGLSTLKSFLISVSDLKEITLNIFSLTERWAEWILSVIQGCSTLHKLTVETDWFDGLLLEEGIRILEKSQKRTDCTLIVSGMRCQKPTNQCTVDPQKMFELIKLSCNKNVMLQF